MKIKTPIKKFEIHGLYGEKNIKIPFKSHVKILVGENGTGKTTVLNILYYLLSNKTFKLRQMPFKKIVIEFFSGNIIEVNKDDISIPFDKLKKSNVFSHITKRISEDHLMHLVRLVENMPKSELKRSGAFRSAIRRIDMPSSMLIDVLESFYSESPQLKLFDSKIKVDDKKIQKLRNSIKKHFPHEIKYFPTYRRVEEDLRNLGLDSDDLIFEENIIQFGMKDVNDLLNKITSEIKNSSVEWFSKVNGQMLAQLVEGFKIDETMKKSLKNPEALKVVLERIGNNINEENKNLIINLIETGTIFDKKHDPLTYFLSNLIKVYEQQKDNDNAIKEFAEICNRYLVDKRVVYNESSVTISILRNKNNKEVNIENLSSGEKQIISLFSKLFLGKNTSTALFFDEPELSLSMEWQKHFLTDILRSDKCSFLFATTHSPFIFDNELKANTFDLQLYIEEL